MLIRECSYAKAMGLVSDGAAKCHEIKILEQLCQRLARDRSTFVAVLEGHRDFPPEICLRYQVAILMCYFLTDRTRGEHVNNRVYDLMSAGDFSHIVRGRIDAVLGGRWDFQCGTQVSPEAQAAPISKVSRRLLRSHNEM